MYAVWDPALVAAALRSKDLSFTPFMVSMMKPLFLVNDHTHELVRGPDAELTNTFMAVIAPSLAGDNLRSLNSNALGLLEKFFSNTERVTDESNLCSGSAG